MPRFPEVIQFRAPAGANEALEAIARAEGRLPNELLREVLAERLKAAGRSVAAAQRAA